MRVLITGGHGLVGHAVQATAPAGITTAYSGMPRPNQPNRGGFDADLTDANACQALFDRFRPTHVLHLAARVGGVGANSRANADFFRDNILINTHVLDAVRRSHTEHGPPVERTIALLSSCVYPDAAAKPLREADLHAGEPHPSNFGYAYAKRMLEVHARALREQVGCHIACLIPNNLYGPHDHFDLEAGHVIPALIRKIHAASIDGAPPVLWGDGTPLREFTFSHDLGRALWWALSHYDGPPLNAGTSVETSIRQAAETICRAFHVDPARLVWDTARPSGQHRKPTDTTRYRALANLPDTPFETGIAETVRWYLAKYPNVRGVE